MTMTANKVSTGSAWFNNIEGAGLLAASLNE
jgi:hypothetical protein